MQLSIEIPEQLGFELKTIVDTNDRVSDTNSLREDLKKQIAVYYGLEAGV